MKKVKTIIASLMIMCATAIMSACSCSGNTTPGVTPVAVDTISITSEFEGIGTYVGDYVLYENAGFVVAYMYIDGQWHSYYPDYFVEFVDGRKIYEKKNNMY